jgi:ABC-2 type transport system ATP-binding protein
MTLVISSHILAELDQYAKELLILQNGCIVKDDMIAGNKGRNKKIMIRCGSEKENIVAVAKEMDSIVDISNEEEYICVEFSGNEQDISLFLRILTENEISIIEFFIKKEGVQEQYLETVKISREIKR